MSSHCWCESSQRNNNVQFFFAHPNTKYIPVSHSVGMRKRGLTAIIPRGGGGRGHSDFSWHVRPVPLKNHLPEWSLSWKSIPLFEWQIVKNILPHHFFLRLLWKKYLFLHVCRFRYPRLIECCKPLSLPQKYPFTQMCGRTCLPTQVLSGPSGNHT